MNETIDEIIAVNDAARPVDDWRSHRVVCFNGSSDTKKYSGQDYDTLTLDQVFRMEPGSAEKMQALAIIPSGYCASDARTHEVQREKGRYVALALDVDTGNLSLNVVAGAIQVFAGENTAALVYSSSSASAEQQKWRGIIPLAKPVGFEQWQELQHCLFRHFQQVTGIKPDYALDRAGQPVYMPNVPPARRDAFGDPEFYHWISLGSEGLRPSSGRVREVIQALRQERAALDAEMERRREQARRDAMRRTASRGDGRSAIDLIKRFNDANSIEDLLRANGYDQRGRSKDWRSPYQSSGSYATRNYGTHWISLSESDSRSGLGRHTAKSASACFGDAFDLFLHFEHGGSIKRALRALSDDERQERREDMARFEPAVSAADEFAEFIKQASGEVVESASVEAMEQQTPEAEKPVTQIKPDATVIRRAAERIRQATQDELLHDVPEFISTLVGIDDKALESLAQDYKKALAKHDYRIKIEQARETIINKPLAAAHAAAKQQAMEEYQHLAKSTSMLKDWVYLEQSERFINLRDGREVSKQSFDMIHAMDVPIMPDDDRPQSPSRFFSMNEGRTAYAQMYVPKFWTDAPDGQFFRHELRQYLNSYSGRTVPGIAADWQQREHWRVIQSHMHKLMGSEREAGLMIKWMAHNVQHPGVKILWAPVIYGPQGSGKTTIERIMSAAMGQVNVKSINMDEVYSAFSGWAQGSCVAFIEEIRIVGHSRHDLTNKLKPYITNDRIKVVRKGFDGVDALNTQNYCCFTNFQDALPLDREDRRYGVMSTAAKTREDVVQMFDQDYWAALYQAINEHPGDIRAWLMSHDLEDFDRIAAPPMTQGKLDMIEAARPDDLVNLEIVIESGGHGVSANVVSQSHVNQAMKAAGYAPLNGRRLRKCLDDLGFAQVPWIVKFDGKACRFSVRGELLEELVTLPGSHHSIYREKLRGIVKISEF